MFTDWQKDFALVLGLILAFLEVLVGTLAILIHRNSKDEQFLDEGLRRTWRLVGLAVAFFLCTEVVFLPFCIIEPGDASKNVIGFTYAMQAIMVTVVAIIVFFKCRCSVFLALFFSACTTILLVAANQLTVPPNGAFQLVRLQIHLQNLSSAMLLGSMFMFLVVAMRLGRLIVEDEQVSALPRPKPILVRDSVDN